MFDPIPRSSERGSTNLGNGFSVTHELNFRVTFSFHVRCLEFLRRRGRGRSPPLDWGGGFRFLGPLAGEHGQDPILALRYRFNECGRFVADLPYIRRYGIAVWVVVNRRCEKGFAAYH